MATLKEILSAKTNEQLKYYIQNVDKHTEEAVRVALAELQARNVDLPEDIAAQIEANIEAKQGAGHDSTNNWRKNIVEDVDAPEYYSQTAIYVFSILFSVLFGSVMMAINLKRAEKKWGWAILYGFGFTVAFAYLTQFISGPSISLSFIGNAVGVTIMSQLFWNSQIGKETRYRAKPIWIPLIIGIFLMIPIIYFVIRKL